MRGSAGSHLALVLAHFRRQDPSPSSGLLSQHLPSAYQLYSSIRYNMFQQLLEA